MRVVKGEKKPKRKDMIKHVYSESMPWIDRLNTLRFDFVIQGAHKGYYAVATLGDLSLVDSPPLRDGKPTIVHTYIDNPISKFSIVDSKIDNLMVFLLEFQEGERDVLIIQSDKILKALLKNKKYDEDLYLTEDERSALNKILRIYLNYQIDTVPIKRIRYTKDNREQLKEQLINDSAAARIKEKLKRDKKTAKIPMGRL